MTLLEVGRIDKAQGLRGEVVVTLTTTETTRIAPGSELLAGDRLLVVAESRPHQHRWAVRFEGITSRESAEPLARAVLRAEAPEETDPDDLWVHELVGSTVVEPDGTDRGVVEAVQDNPASDLLVLDTGRPRAAPVPRRARRRRTPGRRRARRAVRHPRGLRRAPAVRIDVFTIFPDMVVGVRRPEPPRAGRRERGLLDVRVHDLRAHTTDVHRTVDDTPFGGGAGMVLMPEPIYAAVEAAEPPRPLFLLGPGGRTLDQGLARELAAGEGFSLLCGRYEGVDDRVRTELCDGELSIGDYVLGGGEVAAMVVLEAVGRLVPGVMGNSASAGDESFSDGLLEYPQFTKPAVVPGPRRARGAALGRPRPGRPLAPGPGPAPHPRRPSRPDRGAGVGSPPTSSDLLDELAPDDP